MRRPLSSRRGWYVPRNTRVTTLRRTTSRQCAPHYPTSLPRQRQDGPFRPSLSTNAQVRAVEEGGGKIRSGLLRASRRGGRYPGGHIPRGDGPGGPRWRAPGGPRWRAGRGEAAAAGGAEGGEG